MTYYVFIENDKIKGVGQARLLNESVTNLEIPKELFDAYVEEPEKYVWSSEGIIINPNYEQERADKERARIDSLTVTKADFFDATIQAFGLNDAAIEQIINQVLSSGDYDDKTKMIAMNHFKNAKDFYRNHELFKVLSDTEIKVSDTVSITITSTQLDNYFINANKPDTKATAYLALIT